jgi:dTMP kinase
VTEKAPFIPPSPDSEPIPPAPWKVFKAKGFPQLFGAQVVSSIGDWTALIAIIAMAERIAGANAIGLVMIARMLPGFLLAPIGGALVDRWNRKAVMVSCDIGRAGLLVMLPFWDTLLGLVVISFSIEVLTLLWGPAKDASVPNIVKDPDQLASANSLSLVAAFGTMPIGSLMFALLAAVSSWLGNFDSLERFRVEQVSLAIWVDSATFLVSAILISGLVLTNGDHAKETDRPPTSQTWRDIVDGLRFIRSNPVVRGVMVGIAGGLIGGGMVVPLGVLFTKDILNADDSAYGFLTTALGFGAAIGVVTLLWLQRRLPRERVFTTAVIVTGVSISVLACVSTLAFAILLVGLFGAAAGCGYVTGFTLLQESVADEMRGRTFAMLYAVVRVCLILSLTIAPFAASALGAIADATLNGELSIGSADLSLPGVRLALWAGGLLTIFAGIAASRRIRKSRQQEAAPA